MIYHGIRDKQFISAFDLSAKKTLSELGEDVLAAILYHAGKIQGVEASEALNDPIKFAASLEKIFSTGSAILEDKIIDSMCGYLGTPLNIGGSFEQKIVALYNLVSEKRSNSIQDKISILR